MTKSNAAAPRTRLTGEQRRAAIVDAATEVFAEHGYRRGRVSEIAARLGVTEPVVFQNFGTKGALYCAVLDRATTAACAVLAAVSEYGSVSELLTMVLSPSHVEQFHVPGSPGALFADAAGLIAEPNIGEAARDALNRIATSVADLLAHGQRSGEVRADLDPAAGAWWILSLMSARTFRTAIAPDPAAVEAQLAAMTLRILVS